MKRAIRSIKSFALAVISAGLWVLPGALTTSASGDPLEDAMSILDRIEVAPVTFDDRPHPLSEVLQRLSEASGLPIWGDWESMRRLGVKPDTQVQLRVQDASVATALSGLMLVLGGEFSRPVYEVHAGSVVITTIEATEAMRLTDVYDVRDLLRDRALIEQLKRERPPLEFNDPHAPVVPDESIAAPEEEKEEEERKKEKVPSPPARFSSKSGADLLYLILDHVDPDAWVDFGGTRGKISEREGVLIVTVAPTTHHLLRQALAKLRRANPTDVVVEAAIVELPEEAYRRLRRGSPEDRGLCRAILRHPQVQRLWGTEGVVALNELLLVRAQAGAISVELQVTPLIDRERDLFLLEVVARTAENDDEREVRTKIAVAARFGAAVIELPAAAAPSAQRRLLLIVPDRQ